MKITETTCPCVLVIEPAVHGDARGFFMECFNLRQFRQEVGECADFVQDNHSRSARNVLRGLHYQVLQPQGKLVRVVSGAIFDVAVDIRRDSPDFGRWSGVVLSAENHRQLWVPRGFAHGFLVVSETADVVYKTTDYWAPEHERCIAWNDPDIGIAWPVGASPILSVKDRSGSTLRDAQLPGIEPNASACSGEPTALRLH